jgi:predicted transcriptional regulator
MDDRPEIEPGESASPEATADSHSEREARLASLRAAIQRGIDDADAGRVVDLDEAFDRIEAMLDRMEAARRG